MGCNGTGKILMIVGAVVMLIGVIIVIVAVVGADNAVQMGFVAENSPNLNLYADTASHSGWQIFIRADSPTPCLDFTASLRNPDGTTETMSHGDGFFIGGLNCDPTEVADQPKLQSVFSVDLKSASSDSYGIGMTGTYTLTASEPMWARDTGKELGEAVGGVMAAITMISIAIVVAICGSIVMCVGCCCCQDTKQKGGGGGPVTVVGQPAMVEMR